MPLAVTTYTDNTSNVLPLADYGVKIAKAGFDALTAADKDLLYNSSWPSIQIVKVIPFDGTVFTFAHDLTFPPFAILISPDGTYSGGAMDGVSSDEINVYLSPFSTGSGSIIIYNINLSVDVEYPYSSQIGANTGYNRDYGIKMAKNNTSIDSSDMRDYILHSRTGSPLVLAVKTQETVSSANPQIVQYSNQIGYPTLNFGFIKILAATTFRFIAYQGQQCYYSAPLQSQAYPITYTNGVRTYIPFGTLVGGVPVDDGATLVILRNPSFATTNSVSVTY